MMFNIVKNGITMSVGVVPGSRGLGVLGGMGFYFTRHDEDGTSISLGPVALAEIVRVFRGECESIRDGEGLRNCGKTFNVEHTIEPSGYRVSVKRDGGKKFVVFIDYAEALVLSLAIEHSMPFLLFGEDLVRLY